MKTIRRAAILTVCLVTALALPQPAWAGGIAGTQMVEGKRVYLVKPGDSLSGIASREFGDPARWNELLQLNPQVKDPALIYPGDSIVLEKARKPVSLGARKAEVKPAVAGAPRPAPVVAPEEFMEGAREYATAGLVMRNVAARETPQYSPLLYETCGFISTSLPEAAVIGSIEEKTVFSNFDVVFINRGDRDGLTAGQEFRVLRAVKEIYHPVTGDYVGWLVKVVGRLRCECLQAGTATARVMAAYDTIERGDRLEPYTPVSLPADRYFSPKLAGPCVPGGSGVEAVVLAVADAKNLIGEGDVVYLDKGLSSGVTPGMKLAVYREGLPDEDGPDQLLGEMKILLSQNSTATALVTSGLTGIFSDDGVRSW